jgi:alkylated DNA repair protein alkB family protein 1
VLCGHLDDVELTFEAPIVSISLGLSAIFLYGLVLPLSSHIRPPPHIDACAWPEHGRLGGRTREEKPRAMLLRSGDVVVMGGASRLLYHGVPRILPATLPPELAHHRLAGTEPHLAHVVDYLSKRRININARQVLPTGCDFPSTAPSPEKGELAC